MNDIKQDYPHEVIITDKIWNDIEFGMNKLGLRPWLDARGEQYLRTYFHGYRLATTSRAEYYICFEDENIAIEFKLRWM